MVKPNRKTRSPGSSAISPYSEHKSPTARRVSAASRSSTAAASPVNDELVPLPELHEIATHDGTAGSPVAYQDAPEFSKFVAEDSARLVAAVKKIGKVE